MNSRRSECASGACVRVGCRQFRRTMEGLVRWAGPPLVTTVCRSSRDGYSPFHLLGKVERQVLAMLTATLPQGVGPAPVIHYDVELLGGQAGWQWGPSQPTLAAGQRAKPAQPDGSDLRRH